jgi:hypothetical protein
MWQQFVDKVVAKLFSISSEVNIFTSLFGGMFGLGGGSTGNAFKLSNGTTLDSNFGISSIFSGANGFDVPDIPGDIPMYVHRKEMVLPADLADVIRNGGNSNSNSVVVTQNFNGTQDASVVAQIKASVPYIISQVENAVNNKTSMRNAVRKAST